MENLSSGETKRTSHQENGGCLSLCLIKKLDMVGWLVGWLVGHANSTSTSVGRRRDSICTLLNRYVSHSDFFSSWFSWGRIFMRRMILCDKGARSRVYS